jgi:hypothetical protein
MPGGEACTSSSFGSTTNRCRIGPHAISYELDETLVRRDLRLREDIARTATTMTERCVLCSGCSGRDDSKVVGGVAMTRPGNLGPFTFQWPRG